MTHAGDPVVQGEARVQAGADMSEEWDGVRALTCFCDCLGRQWCETSVRDAGKRTRRKKKKRIKFNYILHQDSTLKDA